MSVSGEDQHLQRALESAGQASIEILTTTSRRQKRVLYALVLVVAILLAVVALLIAALIQVDTARGRAKKEGEAGVAEQERKVAAQNAQLDELESAVVAAKEEADEWKAESATLRSLLEQQSTLAPSTVLRAPAVTSEVETAKLEQLEELCRATDPSFEACRIYGDMLIDMEKMKKRCTLGDAVACSLQEEFSAMGDRARTQARRKRALVWYLRGCTPTGAKDQSRVRSQRACAGAGDVFLKQKDEGQAGKYLGYACFTGDARSCQKLGYLYRKDEDAVARKALYLASCLGGDGRGCFYFSHEFKSDWPLRRHILRSGCNLGHDKSCAELRGLAVNGQP